LKEQDASQLWFDGQFRRRRGWLVRRALLAADVIGLSVAFLVSELILGSGDGKLNRIGLWSEYAAFVASIPLWLIGAKLLGLYDRDEERADHSTADDLARVFVLVTVGSFLFTRVALFTDLVQPDLGKLTLFWAAAVVLVTAARVVARMIVSRSAKYVQRTVIVGAGSTGQLIARKVRQHPEYGLDLIGFVDSDPRPLRSDLENVPVLGELEELPDIVRTLNVERVIVAFVQGSDEETLAPIRIVRELDVQIDIVPRLFEVMSPRSEIHSVEGLPVLGLPPIRIARSSRLVKRSVDVIGSSVGLLVTAPLFAYIAWRIKRDSPGPVFFRQTRLGENMREFTILKFRTMKVGTSQDAHREAIRSTMDWNAVPAGGLFKADQSDSVTRIGAWLRRTSLDELPQLINVLRGEMSLVGPRPSLPYEKEYFAAHHFERFLLPPGLTGLWQVTARSHSTWGEALEMDVAYVRGWSLGLDLRLIFRTPGTLARFGATR
jgi:exopolysaccharide biosynthesis polyprenyl glycosylphosphotransferase